MNRIDRLKIIGDIVSYLLYKKYKPTISKLSYDCEVPELKMRKWLRLIFKNKLLGSMSPSKKLDNKTQKTFDHYKVDEPIFVKFIDNLNEDKYEELNYIFLTITHEQLSIMEKIYPEFIKKNTRERFFELKDDELPVSNKIIDRMKSIEQAKSYPKKIKFYYKKKKDEPTELIDDCSPVDLFHNQTINKYYLRATDKKNYRLDRFQSDVEILDKKSEIDKYMKKLSDKQKERANYFFYEPYITKEHVVEVEFKIILDNINTRNKIERETAHREGKGREIIVEETVEGKKLTYKDKIIGLDRFYEWMKKYERNMTVIKPQKLIDMVKRDTKQAIRLYKLLEKKKKTK